MFKIISLVRLVVMVQQCVVGAHCLCASCGLLLIRGCPKAYHPACIKRDEAFFRSRAKWNCGMLNITTFFSPRIFLSHLNEWMIWFYILICYTLQVGIYVALARKLHIICAILVHTLCAKDVLKTLIMYVWEEAKDFVERAWELSCWLRICKEIRKRYANLYLLSLLTRMI